MAAQIPPFTVSGVLPPFVGSSPATPSLKSPYVTNIVNFCDRFGSSKVHDEILLGYLAHRAALNGLGFIDGFQWCDGSFVEESDPADIDVVTFCNLPRYIRNKVELEELIKDNLEVFDPNHSKLTYKCDVYFVYLGLPPTELVRRTHYWFGLFSHRRETAEWKGLVEIPLNSPDDDRVAATLLEKGAPEGSTATP